MIRFWIGMLIMLVGLISGVLGVDYALTVHMGEATYGVPWWGTIIGGGVIALT